MAGDFVDGPLLWTPIAMASGKPTFSLLTLLLIVTTVCVCLGSVLLHPPTGVYVTFVGVPSVLRTLWVVRRYHQRGETLSPLEQVHHFLISCGVVFLISVSALIAFATACLPIGSVAAFLLCAGEEFLGYAVFFSACLAGLIAAGYVCWRFGKRLWFWDVWAAAEPASASSKEQT